MARKFPRNLVRLLKELIPAVSSFRPVLSAEGPDSEARVQIGPLPDLTQDSCDDSPDICSNASLRLQMLKALRENDGLTPYELGELLDLPSCLVRGPLKALRDLRLIEQGGTRPTPDGVQGVFRIEWRHPSLEFILGPAPEGLVSPHEVRARNRSQGDS